MRAPLFVKTRGIRRRRRREWQKKKTKRVAPPGSDALSHTRVAPPRAVAVWRRRRPARSRRLRPEFNFNVIDTVVVPADLAPGDYALSWRFDSEQTPQVWTNCADVTVRVAAAAGVRRVVDQ